MIEEAAGVQVQVPTMDSPLQPHELAILQTIIDPLEEDNDMGVRSYAATKLFVEYCQTQRIIMNCCILICETFYKHVICLSLY